VIEFYDGLLKSTFNIVLTAKDEVIQNHLKDVEQSKLERLKAIELEKKVFIDMKESELKNRFNDYEEMLAHQSELSKRIE